MYLTGPLRVSSSDILLGHYLLGWAAAEVLLVPVAPFTTIAAPVMPHFRRLFLLARLG